MNPVKHLELLGWINTDKRIRAKKTGNTWRLTFVSSQYIGQDTINYISGYLQTHFTVISHRKIGENHMNKISHLIID